LQSTAAEAMEKKLQSTRMDNGASKLLRQCCNDMLVLLTFSARKNLRNKIAIRGRYRHNLDKHKLKVYIIKQALTWSDHLDLIAS
jgi:hypothetical protein